METPNPSPLTLTIQPSRDARRRRMAIVGVVAAAALGCALRFYNLDSESLWIDELTQVSTYQLPLTYIVREAANSTQPPLDYWIGAGLDRLQLADSDWWVRAPAAVFGTIAILLIGWWAWRLHGPVAAATSALLLAFCPLHLAMSQEARPYTIFMVLALVTVALFDLAWRRNRFHLWVMFGLGFLALVFSRWVEPHFIAAGLLLYCVVAWARGRRAEPGHIVRPATLRLWAALTTILLAYVIYGPVFGIVFDRNRQAVDPQSGAWWERFLSNLDDAATAILSGYSARTLRPSDFPEWPVLLAGILALAGLIVLAVRVWRWRDSMGGAFLATIVLFPFTFGIAFVLLTGTPAKPQYLLLLAVPLLLGLAICAESMRRAVMPAGPQAAWATFAVIVGIALVPMAYGSYQSLTTIEKCDWRGAMGFLRGHVGRGDAFASVGSDTMPPSYHALVPRIERYFEPDSRFLWVDADAKLDVLNKFPWTRADGRVWIVCYNDRMYRGYDLLPTPNSPPPEMRIHPFNGLFIVEVGGEKPAAEKFMDGLAFVGHDLPGGSSLIAPHVVRGRYLYEQGDFARAAESFDEARRQCRDSNELAILERDYLPNISLSASATPSK